MELSVVAGRPVGLILCFLNTGKYNVVRYFSVQIKNYSWSILDILVQFDSFLFGFVLLANYLM